MMVMFFLVCVVISMCFVLLAILFEKTSFYSLQKQNFFECGFSSFKSSRVSFSLQFFVVGIIFVLFDLEIVLLILLLVPVVHGLFIFLFFSFILFLYYTWWLEWKLMNLKWHY